MGKDDYEGEVVDESGWVLMSSWIKDEFDVVVFSLGE